MVSLTKEKTVKVVPQDFWPPDVRCQLAPEIVTFSRQSKFSCFFFPLSLLRCKYVLCIFSFPLCPFLLISSSHKFFFLFSFLLLFFSSGLSLPSLYLHAQCYFYHFITLFITLSPSVVLFLSLCYILSLIFTLLLLSLSLSYFQSITLLDIFTLTFSLIFSAL